MRLSTSGIASSSLRVPVVGTVSREVLPKDRRADRVLVLDTMPINNEELFGYSGSLECRARTNSKCSNDIFSPRNRSP